MNKDHYITDLLSNYIECRVITEAWLKQLCEAMNAYRLYYGWNKESYDSYLQARILEVCRKLNNIDGREDGMANVEDKTASVVEEEIINGTHPLSYFYDREGSSGQ